MILIAAGLKVLLPIGLAYALLFGGVQATGCLALVGCPDPVDGPIPIIGTAAGFPWVVAMLAIAWAVLFALSTWYLWFEDRRRLGLAAGSSFALVIATGPLVAA